MWFSGGAMDGDVKGPDSIIESNSGFDAPEQSMPAQVGTSIRPRGWLLAAA